MLAFAVTFVIQHQMKLDHEMHAAKSTTSKKLMVIAIYWLEEEEKETGYFAEDEAETYDTTGLREALPRVLLGLRDVSQSSDEYKYPEHGSPSGTPSLCLPWPSTDSDCHYKWQRPGIDRAAGRASSKTQGL